MKALQTKILKKIRRTFYIIPDWLYLSLGTLYWRLRPDRDNVVIMHSKGCWLAKWEDLEIFIPRPVSFAWHMFRSGKMGITLYQQRLFEKYTLSPFVEVKHGDVVCDVGAYIGGFTLAVANKAKKVLAFEPDPCNYACLKRNTSHLQKVCVYQRILWSCEGTLELNLGFKPSDSSVLNVDGWSRGKRVDVHASRLDKLISELEVEKVDFLKVDAEGAEPEVLKGASGILETVRNVSVDCAPERYGKPTVSEVRRILDSTGFNIQIRGYVVYGWR